MSVPATPRPRTPDGFDASRAAERAADPGGWRYADDRRQAVFDVIAQRRDIRRFRPDDVPDDVLERVLTAGHQAPSVGHMQPWRFIVVREARTRSAVRLMAQRERLRQAEAFDARTRDFLALKVEGIVDAPLGIVVCCDPGDADAVVLGRGTIPETDLYSAACAIENLWLAARAEGLGVGWVSFYRREDMRDLLGIPERVDPMAYLCLGWPDERPVRPGLEAAGWSSRVALDAVVMDERWDGTRPDKPATGTPDRRAAGAARDRSDRLVKPSGSLGALEGVAERWASITGGPVPVPLRAGVLVCAADHGHVTHGTALFDAEVSAQVSRAAARAQSAAGVLARHGGHALLVADVGLAGPTPEGVRAAKVAAGSADMLVEPALTDTALDAAMRAGARLAGELADGGAPCLAVGEIGIGNTTTTAALAAALTGAPVEEVVGRGTGMDSAGLARKREAVTAAVARHVPAGETLGGREALRAVGGLELAALAGAMLECTRRGLPVLLDGYATAAAALTAVRMDPLVAEVLLASHRSAEPGHALLLPELGLEPLLDLRLRLGEASGALLALPLIESAGVLQRDMGTFAETGVSTPR